MADGVDAAMHAVQPADAHAALDRAAAEAGVDELPTAHHAVLARRESAMAASVGWSIVHH